MAARHAQLALGNTGVTPGRDCPKFPVTSRQLDKGYPSCNGCDTPSERKTGNLEK